MTEGFPRAGEAYRIFVEEVRRFCDDLHKLELSGMGEADYHELAKIFHRIKGGAGLFAMEEIRSACGEMELLMREWDCSAESKRKIVVKLENFIRLGRQISELEQAAGVK